MATSTHDIEEVPREYPALLLSWTTPSFFSLYFPGPCNLGLSFGSLCSRDLFSYLSFVAKKTIKGLS